MTISKVTAGDTFSAALSAGTWNAFVDAANDYRLRSVRNPAPVRVVAESPNNTVMIRNDTGADVAAGSVLAITAPIIMPANNPTEFVKRAGYVGDTPAAANHGNFVITASAIPAGKIGLAYIDGVVQCKVNRSYDFISFADIAVGETGYLEAKPEGTAQILWIAEGTGELWATVRLGCRRDVTLTGRPDANVTAGGTGTVSIFNDGANTGYNVTGVKLDWMHGDEDISQGRDVQIQWFDAELLWRFVGAECEATDENPPTVAGQVTTLNGGGITTLANQPITVL